MLGASSTHIAWISENGIFTYSLTHPYFSTIFWDCLTFFDIAAAVLLLLRPKIGLILTLIIITIDVIHNNLLLIIYNQHINTIGFQVWATTYWMLVAQLVFMAFVLITFKTILADVNTAMRYNNINKEKLQTPANNRSFKTDL